MTRSIIIFVITRTVEKRFVIIIHVSQNDNTCNNDHTIIPTSFVFSKVCL